MASNDLTMSDELRASLGHHLEHLRSRYLARGWGGRTGFGQRPAVIAIDLARFWLDPGQQIGSSLDKVVEATCRVLDAARRSKIPVFFTTFDFDPTRPITPHDGKLSLKLTDDSGRMFELDPRLDRRPDEVLIKKPFASAFKGTNLMERLKKLGIDTLIVTGISTSHCVYATCRDGTDDFHIIVPREAVGERCELMHEVFLLDIDIDLGDVMPVQEAIENMNRLAATR